MITTSHKPQAKRITTRTLYSSTDVTNFIKIKTQRSWWSSTDATNLKKIISTRSWWSSTESLFFFIIKSNKQQASSELTC